MICINTESLTNRFIPWKPGATLTNPLIFPGSP